VAVCNSILEDDLASQDSPGQPLSDAEIALRLDHLKSVVFGQGEAVQRLFLIALSHLKKTSIPGSIKANTILVGPTGCGKSHTLSCVFEALSVPLTHVDAMRILASGYLSDRDPIAKLLSKAGDNVERASHGVICIENMDKLADPKGFNREGRRIQQALLSVFDGTETKVGDQVIPTAAILFVGCGTFLPPSMNSRGSSSEPILSVPENLIPLGFIPEFATRFAHVIRFERLDENHLLEILKAENSQIIRRFENLFSHAKIKLHFSDGAIEAIAKESSRRAGGARSIYAVLEEVALNAAMECGGRDDISTFAIDGDFVQRTLA